MDLTRFIEAASKNTSNLYKGADRISGTNKIRTYCANASLYTKESDLNEVRKLHDSVFRTSQKSP